MPNLDLKGKFLDGATLKILATQLGSRRLAIGTVVEFWELAQQYWAQDQKLIPMKMFKALQLPDALLEPDLGLAEVNEEGEIYAKGSQEQFEWLLTQAEKGRLGGVASTEARRRKNSNLAQAPLKQGPSTLQAPFELTKPPVPVPVPEEGRRESGSDQRTYHDLPPEAGEAPTLPLLAQVWNELADPKLARVKRVSASRERHARNRWKEEPTREFWSDVIWKINQSDFCLGKNQRGWKADFDFLVRPDTAAKVLEGKYDNRGPNGSGPKRVNPEVERVNKIPTKPMRFE